MLVPFQGKKTVKAIPLHPREPTLKNHNWDCSRNGWLQDTVRAWLYKTDQSQDPWRTRTCSFQEIHKWLSTALMINIQRASEGDLTFKWSNPESLASKTLSKSQPLPIQWSSLWTSHTHSLNHRALWVKDYLLLDDCKASNTKRCHLAGVCSHCYNKIHQQHLRHEFGKTTRDDRQAGAVGTEVRDQSTAVTGMLGKTRWMPAHCTQHWPNLTWAKHLSKCQMCSLVGPFWM